MEAPPEGQGENLSGPSEPGSRGLEGYKILDIVAPDLAVDASHQPRVSQGLLTFSRPPSVAGEAKPLWPRYLIAEGSPPNSRSHGKQTTWGSPGRADRGRVRDPRGLV